MSNSWPESRISKAAEQRCMPVLDAPSTSTCGGVHYMRVHTRSFQICVTILGEIPCELQIRELGAVVCSCCFALQAVP